MNELIFWILSGTIFVFYFIGVRIGREQVKNNLDYFGREISKEIKE